MQVAESLGGIAKEKLAGTKRKRERKRTRTRTRMEPVLGSWLAPSCSPRVAGAAKSQAGLVLNRFFACCRGSREAVCVCLNWTPDAQGM